MTDNKYDDCKISFLEVPNPYNVTFIGYGSDETVEFQFFNDGKFDIKVSDNLSTTKAVWTIFSRLKMFANDPYNSARFNEGWNKGWKEGIQRGKEDAGFPLFMTGLFVGCIAMILALMSTDAL